VGRGALPYHRRQARAHHDSREEWKIIEDEALKFWVEIAAQSPRNAKVVEILKKYQETMRKAGAPYRYG